MIFNTESSYTGVVKESPYPLGVEGALMHVYENECNYNAMMRAVGISELKYYQETGKDLFLHEAGAFSGFIKKAIAFFNKIIEKIKSIFHKFAALMNSFTMKDKDFVHKYEAELNRKDLTDFEFNGYTFKGLDTAIKIVDADVISAVTSDLNKMDVKDYKKDDENKLPSADELEDEIDRMRADVVSGLVDAKSLDESEFREEVRDAIYGGDKEPLENIRARDQLNIIKNAQNDIKDANRKQKQMTDGVNKIIKKLEGYIKNDFKYTDEEKDNEALSKQRSASIKHVNQEIDKYKANCNAITILYGIIVGALKDRNRQAKAICVKAIGYKHESASLYESSNDLFANVVIR